MCLHGKIKLIHASKLHLHERFEQKRLAKLTDSLCFDKVLRDPTQHGGAGRVEEEKERLSSIIDRLNKRFGTDFTEADKLSRDQIIEDMKADEELVQKAQSNTKDNFKFSFQRVFMDFVINRMQSNETFFMKILENPDFKNYLMEDVLDEVYTDLRKTQ